MTKLVRKDHKREVDALAELLANAKLVAANPDAPEALRSAMRDRELLGRVAASMQQDIDHPARRAMLAVTGATTAAPVPLAATFQHRACGLRVAALVNVTGEWELRLLTGEALADIVVDAADGYAGTCDKCGAAWSVRRRQLDDIIRNAAIHLSQKIVRVQ